MAVKKTFILHNELNICLKDKKLQSLTHIYMVKLVQENN